MARRGRKNEKETVHSVTSVQRALSEDVDDRATRYLISMAIRTACVLLAVVLPSPWLWIAVAGAVLLPLLSVLVANAGRELPAKGATEDPRAVATWNGPPPTGAPPRAPERFEATTTQRKPYDPNDLGRFRR